MGTPAGSEVQPCFAGPRFAEWSSWKGEQISARGIAFRVSTMTGLLTVMHCNPTSYPEIHSNGTKSSISNGAHRPTGKRQDLPSSVPQIQKENAHSKPKASRSWDRPPRSEDSQSCSSDIAIYEDGPGIMNHSRQVLVPVRRRYHPVIGCLLNREASPRWRRWSRPHTSLSSSRP